MRIDWFLFGYIEIRIPSDEIAKAVTRLLKEGLTGNITNSGILVCPLNKRRRYESCLSGISFSKSAPRGVGGMLFNNKWRMGALLALILALLFAVCVSDFVWDIRIVGNENKTVIEIEDELNSAGLKIGSRWSKLSLAKLERQVLDNSDEIAWININKKGTVAYVTLKEKTQIINENIAEGYSNIVSTIDCVIEEITVESGVAAVKAGDTVKAGQLLISGIVKTESGITFCHAAGNVIGRTRESVRVDVPRNERKTFYDKEVLRNLSINFLNTEINIFKRYGNLSQEYVIINEKTRFAISERIVFPIVINKKYAQKKITAECNYNDNQLITIAEERLRRKRAILMNDCEILSIKNYGDFTESGYYMVSEMEILKNVCRNSDFA